MDNQQFRNGYKLKNIYRNKKVGVQDIDSNPVMVEELDLDQALPSHMTILSAGTHLYSIGLSLHSLDSSMKRKAVNNPFFIFIITFIYFTLRLSSVLFMDGMTDRQYFIFGDYPHFLMARQHINLFHTFSFFTVLSSQVIHIWHYYRSPRKPSYLRPFELMSGRCSPNSLG